MKDGYIIYRCNSCKKHFILMSNEVEHTLKESKYITCPYYGKHKDINVIGAIDRYGEINKCMDSHAYRREGRRIKQVK